MIKNNYISNILIVGGGKSKFYRPEIDGLRAIACVSVVLFHAFPEFLKGGFIGVDIFFVISGYLISSILYRSLFSPDSSGKINIIDFYVRRVRRIFPALIAVLITTLVLGWFALLPDEYKNLGKHVVVGSVYTNNLILYKESDDYFNVASNAKPLLHLWSLGVEEQFYLIFPVFLYVIYKLNFNFVLSLTVFTVISYCLNLYGIHHNHQSASFYLPWCRFWELSSGAIFAYLAIYYKKFWINLQQIVNSLIYSDVLRNNTKTSSQNAYTLLANLVSATGLILIISGILTIKNDTSFPGSLALIPVLGSILIIGAGKTAFINKYVLSHSILVFIGLISYPLYLWHWPLLSIAYICEGQQPVAWIRLCAVLIAITLSVLTVFFIEPPLRYGKYPKVKAISLFTILLVTGFFGYSVYKFNGFENRYSDVKPSSEEIQIKKKNKKYNNPFLLFDDYIDNCKEVISHWNDADPNTTCALQSKSGFNNVALLGSSHAAHLFYGLSELAKKNGHSIALFPVGSQSPFINLQTIIDGRLDFYKRITYAYDYIIKHKNIKVVILADLAETHKYIDLENPNETDTLKMLSTAVTRSLNLLKDRKVIIVLDNPWLPFDPKACLRPYQLTLKTCQYKYKESLNYKFAELHKIVINRISKKFDNVQVIDFNQLFCKNGQCEVKINNIVMYKDFNHLNRYGSELVAPVIYKRVFDAITDIAQ